jgi:sugar phosphate isomerase/epimerase
MLHPLAVQLYSLREYAEKDFVGVLKRVAKIGYKGVEPAGFWNIRPRELKKILDDLGLQIVSSHTLWGNPYNLGESMDIADILGLKRVVCGYSAKEFKDLDSIRATAESTSRMAEILERNGFELFQHNHAFEFERLDGQIKYAIYAKLCPKVKFQIDCFWSTNFGREDAVEMLKLFIDRTVSIHIKDGPLQQKDAEQKYVNGTLDRKIELRPLGQGDLPIRQLVAMAPNVDAVIVELDYCNIEMFEAIEASYRFMTGNGIAAGNK